MSKRTDTAAGAHTAAQFFEKAAAGHCRVDPVQPYHAPMAPLDVEAGIFVFPPLHP